MSHSLAPWTCDTCGQPIHNVDDGWVEWIEFKSPEGRKGRDLRLVHSRPASPTGGRCQFNQQAERQRDGGIILDRQLSSFLGPDGLMDLLSLIAESRLPTEDVLEMIKRLNIPGYEQARMHFDGAISEGVFEPNTMRGYYHQVDIEAVLEHLEDQRG